MAGLSQNLKAVITFGGSIDSSWSRSANSLQKSLKACAQGGTCLKCLQLHCSDKAPTCRCLPRPPWLKIFDAVESYAF